MFSTNHAQSNNSSAGNHLSLKDHMIYYETSGTGEPVFLIHGGFLNTQIWKNQIPFLNNNGFKTIAFDDLGHGKTVNGVAEVYGFQIIEEIRKKLSYKRINFIGFSWGSILALDYAQHYPEHVNKLILISPGLNGWDYFHDKNAQIHFDKRKIAKAENDKDQFIELFQKNWTDGPGHDSLRIERKLRGEIERILRMTIDSHWNENWSKVSTKRDWKRISAETQIISGELDALDIKKICGIYDSEIQNSNWIELKNVAHTVMMEKPELVNQIAIDFLKH